MLLTVHQKYEKLDVKMDYLKFRRAASLPTETVKVFIISGKLRY